MGHRVLRHAIALAGLAALVVALFVAVVVAFGRLPEGGEWTLLALSALAAAACALLWIPARERLGRLVPGERRSPENALRAFGTRLTRSLPLDELLLQLAETLRRSLALDAAEVWTGSGGVLERAASVPDRGRSTLILTPAEQAVVARAGVSGQAWAAVWLPQLAGARDEAALRIAPVTSAGELLGLIVVERPPGAAPFGDQDEQLLADLARQLGLTLRNVRLDSDLQASLDELRRQAEELRASRARVVSAADAERRRIERDLHDGAQQHLVGLVVNLRLARELADADPAEAKTVLEGLGRDAKEALEQVRELAHGIYPPLLLDRGLAEALGAAAARAGLPARLEAAGLARYAPEVEATVYFCCLEALQNAAKHAGPGARATVRVWQEQRGLLFEVADDGGGFAAGDGRGGAGMANMRDRLGALGGRLAVASEPGRGTSVTGTIPLAS
jgi:signal transduction histidine kinase